MTSRTKKRSSTGQTNAARSNDGRSSSRSDTRDVKDAPPAASSRSFAQPRSVPRDSLRRRQEFSFDTPKSIKLQMPAPDFEMNDKVIESNLIALKRTRHKLNVHRGGAKRFFQMWGTNKNGRLSRAEMFEGFKSLNLGFSDAQADFLVRAFDKDASDSVEYHEFCEMMEFPDDQLNSEVMSNSLLNPEKAVYPDGWQFTPIEKKKAKDLQSRLRDRIHQVFGNNPRNIREAFLSMDKERAGFLTKEDLKEFVAHMGIKDLDENLEIMLACNLVPDAANTPGPGISYNKFVRFFEPEPVGSFNPFNPGVKIPGLEAAPKPLLTESQAPPEMMLKWSNSYGRDRRYCSVFPDVYTSPLRPGSCPPDFSDNKDFDQIWEWKKFGKIVGRELNSLKPSKPIPPKDSAGYSLRPRFHMQSNELSLERMGSPDLTSTSPPHKLRMTKSRSDLVSEREARFQEKSKILRETWRSRKRT